MTVIMMRINKETLLNTFASGSGDSSVVELLIGNYRVRIPAEAAAEIFLQGQLSVLILISVFVSPPEYRSST